MIALSEEAWIAYAFGGLVAILVLALLAFVIRDWWMQPITSRLDDLSEEHEAVRLEVARTGDQAHADAVHTSDA